MVSLIAYPVIITTVVDVSNTALEVRNKALFLPQRAVIHPQAQHVVLQLPQMAYGGIASIDLGAAGKQVMRLERQQLGPVITAQHARTQTAIVAHLKGRRFVVWIESGQAEICTDIPAPVPIQVSGRGRQSEPGQDRDSQ